MTCASAVKYGLGGPGQLIKFALTRLIRPGAPGWDGGVVQAAPEGRRTVNQAAEISLRLSDGTLVSSDRPRDDSAPTAPILRFNGGGGTANRQVLRFWAWPLPPAGPLEFICQWPTFGIAETRVSIDAQLILDAARRSVQAWPEGTEPTIDGP